MTQKYYLVKVKHVHGPDEIYTMMFNCPAKCGFEYVMPDDNFCAHCGVSLRWSKKVHEYMRSN